MGFKTMEQEATSKSIADFQLFLHNASFPCLGAKSALAHNDITYFLANDIQAADSDAEITKRLQAFARACTPETTFVSFIVIFENSSSMSEAGFERCLWQRLQAIHNRDAKHYAWDDQVSDDPECVDFSMSVGGKGFYVVGLHPNASRPARRFSKPALVFNLHNQFELLREDGRYGSLRKTILERDVKLSGTENPMLAQHGQSSEASQYSGRVTDDNWACPFHAREQNKT